MIYGSKGIQYQKFCTAHRCADNGGHRKWAADEFRSTNGQLQWIIAEALRRSGRKPKANDKTAKGENKGL